MLKGKVTNRQGGPIPGVRAVIAGQPQYGYTLARKDGTYDIALNCGGVVTITFYRQNFIGSQRVVSTTVLSYVNVDNVILIPVDAKVSSPF